MRTESSSSFPGHLENKPPNTAMPEAEVYTELRERQKINTAKETRDALLSYKEKQAQWNIDFAQRNPDRYNLPESFEKFSINEKDAVMINRFQQFSYEISLSCEVASNIIKEGLDLGDLKRYIDTFHDRAMMITTQFSERIENFETDEDCQYIISEFNNKSNEFFNYILALKERTRQMKKIDPSLEHDQKHESFDDLLEKKFTLAREYTNNTLVRLQDLNTDILVLLDQKKPKNTLIKLMYFSSKKLISSQRNPEKELEMPLRIFKIRAKLALSEKDLDKLFDEFKSKLDKKVNSLVELLSETQNLVDEYPN